MADYVWKHKVDVPAGQSGNVEIYKNEVTKAQARLLTMQMTYSQGMGRRAFQGTWTVMRVDGELMMSDTPDEFKDHSSFLYRAKGRVLIGGLGLGLVIKPLLEKPEIEHITVMEISPDVIKLVAPSYQHPKVTIVQADAYLWEPTEKFDLIWLDIWPNISVDNLESMTQLRRRFRKWTVTQKADDVMCWGREMSLYMRDRDRRDDGRMRGW